MASDSRPIRSQGLASLSASELRRLLLRGEISVPELVSAALDAIAAQDGRLHAFLSTSPETALREAGDAQARLKAGHPPPALFGIPLAVKDAEPVAGMGFTAGSLVFRHRVALRDSLHVARLRSAGAIIVGKTNTPEFTLLGETHNRLGPYTCNPWNIRRMPGGSSGGSAAALAAGMVPLATGSDTAGSITAPAAFCGLVGLKPSHRRIPVWPDPEDWQPYSDVGPMARTVHDLVLMLAASAGADPCDPLSGVFGPTAPRPGRLRIAWAGSVAGLPVDPDCAAAAESLALLFQSAGHHVEEAWPDIRDPGPAHDLLGAVEEYRARGALLASHPDLLAPETCAMMLTGQAATADDIATARAVSVETASRMRDFMAGRDIFILPATACPAFPLRQPPSMIGGRTVRPDWPSYAPFNMLANITGFPVATLPMGLSADGLPVGALAFAGFGRDDLLLAALAEAEALRGPFPAAPFTPTH